MSRDEEIVVFHYQLGVAISQWSSVENMIRYIVICMFKHEDLNQEADQARELARELLNEAHAVDARALRRAMRELHA
jgi:hypothetical protein